MPQIDVSELIYDPDFCQDFILHRKTGTWENGRFTSTTSEIPMTGVIVPQKTKEMFQTPDGDTIRGAVDVYTLKPIATTILQEQSWKSDQVSDEIVWRNETYKIMSVENFADFGYYHAVAVRKFGA